jgi:predicted PurR-regulated permease PerM
MIIVVSVLLLISAGLIFIFVWALVDCLRREFNEPTEQIVWIVVILFAGTIGQIIYLIIGRKNGKIKEEVKEQSREKKELK